MLKIKFIKYLISVLFMLSLSVACLAAEFEAFNTELDELEDQQQRLDFVLQQQATAQTWPLEELARFYHQKGLVLEANNQVEAAKQAYTESINTFIELDQPSAYWVQSLQDRSYMDYLLTNDPSTYCEDREAAVEVSRKTEDPASQTSALVFLAFCFQSGFEAFKQGLSVLEEAAAIAQKNDLAGDATAMIHNATGNLYRSNQLDDKAYEYYQKAYDHWAQLGDTQDMFNMQHNLVGESIKLGSWETAEKHIKILFELTESNPGFSDFRFFSHYNQAMLAFAKNDFDAAINDIKSALDLAHTTSEQYFVNALLGTQVVAYFRSGQTEQAGQLATALLTAGELSPSQQELNKQVKLIHEYATGDYLASINTFWQLLDDTKKSKYAFIKNSVALQSITFDQTINQFQEQALGSKLRISELELERRTKQNKINQLTGIAAALLALVFIVVSFYLYKSRQFYLRSSRTDFLTKCHNRRRIFELGSKQLQQCQNNQQPFAVAVLDIDDFKHINDQYGHDLGDQVLIQLVATVKGLLSENQYMGRMGGEEFLINMPDVSLQQAKLLAEKIRQAIAAIGITNQDSVVNFTVSIGLFVSQGKRMAFEEVIKQADMALYTAKDSGKNKVVLNPQG
jgi:diguanylate cyclase (GGDEF)-like protein